MNDEKEIKRFSKAVSCEKWQVLFKDKGKDKSSFLIHRGCVFMHVSSEKLLQMSDKGKIQNVVDNLGYTFRINPQPEFRNKIGDVTSICVQKSKIVNMETTERSFDMQTIIGIVGAHNMGTVWLDDRKILRLNGPVMYLNGGKSFKVGEKSVLELRMTNDIVTGVRVLSKSGGNNFEKL